MDEILAFIGNGGVENPVFINTKDWEKNPTPQNPIKVDAYRFSGGSVYGYIAFMKAHAGRWIIKSFKKERSGDPRSLPFADALQGLVIKAKEEKS